jgi:hypothetical protein
MVGYNLQKETKQKKDIDDFKVINRFYLKESEKSKI